MPELSQQEVFHVHLGHPVNSSGVLSIHIESVMLSPRTWREMRTDFQLKGGEQVGESDDARIKPLSMEDCMGVFFLWLLILITGLVG